MMKAFKVMTTFKHLLHNIWGHDKFISVFFIPRIWTSATRGVAFCRVWKYDTVCRKMDEFPYPRQHTRGN